MQLDSYQRRAMLCKTQYIFAKGYLLAGTLPFLGDVIQKNERELHNMHPKLIGSATTEHIGDVVRELTGLHLGTQFDERSTLAFMEAKQALDNPEADEETAWPKWYIEGQDPPKKSE